MKIQCFIFNWRGQYANACALEHDIKLTGADVVVINSDPDNMKDHWVNLGDDAWFTHQWLEACNLFTGDIFFHVLADVHYTRWQELINHALVYYQKYQWGIYAPNIDYTYHDYNRSVISGVALPDENLKLIANSDCSCWFIHKNIVEDFCNIDWDWSFNTRGWGIDLLLTAACYKRKRLVLRDYTFTVAHKPGSNYNHDVAARELHELIDRCDDTTQQLIYKLRHNKQALLEYLR